MKRFLLVSLFLMIITMIFSGYTDTAVSKTIDLKFAYWVPPQSTPGSLIEEWAKEITAASNGKVRVTTFGGSSMGAPPEHLQLCLSGMADITAIAPGMTHGVLPLSMLFEQPGLFMSAEQGSRVAYQITEKYLMNDEYKKVKVLWIAQMGPSHLHTVKKQVRTIKDLKGLKIAGTSPIEVQAIGNLGAAALQMGTEQEMYTSLERGLIDGRFNSWEAASVFKDFEVTKYRVDNVYMQSHFNVIIMNLDSWNRLPSDMKSLIEEKTGSQRSIHFGTVFDKRDAAAKQMIIDYDKRAGNPEIYSLPDTERAKWMELLRPQVEKWASQNEAKGLPAKAMLEELRSLVK